MVLVALSPQIHPQQIVLSGRFASPGGSAIAGFSSEVLPRVIGKSEIPSRWMPTSTTETFDTLNNTEARGVFNPPSPGYPTTALAVPSLNEFVLGDSQGAYVYVMNATSGAEVAAIRAGNAPDSFAYDPTTGILYCALSGGASNAVAFVNLETERVIRTDSNLSNVEDVAYDPTNQLLYVSNFTGVLALNASTGATIASVFIHWGLVALAVDPLTGDLLAADQGNNTIYAVNTSDLRVVTQFSTGNRGAGVDPDSLLYDPYSLKVYAADSGNGTVSVIDARTYSLNSTHPEIYVGGLPASLALNPSQHEVYVSSCTPDNSRVCAFYDTNDTVVNHTYPGYYPTYVAFDPVSDRLLTYLVNDSVYVYNGSTDQRVAFVPMIDSYLGAALDPTNGLEYIATPNLGGICTVSGSVTIFDPSAHPRVLESVPAGEGPSQVAYDPTDQRVFVTNYCGNSVTAIEATNNSVVQLNLPVGSEPYGIAYDNRTNTLWVANYNSQNLTVLNASSLARVASISTPTGYPYGITYDPTNNSVFVTNDYAASLTVLNASTFAVTAASIPVGTYPQAPLYDPENGLVYVANGGSDNLSVVNATTLRAVGSIPTVAGTSSLALDPADHLLFATDGGGSRIVVVDTLTNTAESPTLPASETPEGVVYDPITRQVDVPNFGTGAINILANLPVVANFSVTPALGEAGQPLSFSVSVTNGTAPYSYAYSGLPAGCASEELAAWSCTPTGNGTFSITVTVRDSLGYTATANTSVSLVPALSTGALTLTPAATDVDFPVNVSWSAQGGALPWTYAYAGLPPGCASVNGSAFSCAPTAAGTYVVEGTVTDGFGVRESAWAVLTVNGPVEVASFEDETPQVEVNGTLVLEASVTGGAGPLRYAYRGLPSGCVSLNAPVLSCAPNVAGNFSVNLTVTDGVGAHASRTIPVDVAALPPVEPPAPVVLAFFAVPANVTLGENVTFYAIVSGGAAPLQVAFGGLPTGCATSAGTATSFSCRPTGTGEFRPTVNVIDGLGRNATGSTSVSVIAPESGSSGHEPTPVELYLAAGVAAVAGGVVGAFVGLYLSRRRERAERAATREGGARE